MKRFVALLVLPAVALTAPGTARAEFVVGLTSANQLVTFDSNTPGAVSAPVAITGLGAGEAVVGIDHRPADGALVALTRQQTGAGVGTGRVYTINLTGTTAAATQINTLTESLTDPNRFTYGVDFNPVPNALRVVNAFDQNLRIAGGGAGATNNDTALGLTQGLNPNIGAVAYANNVAGATTTTLFALDSGAALFSQVQLLTIGSADFPTGPMPVSPNTGQLFPVGTVLPAGTTFSNEGVGFDISGDTGVAFASLYNVLLDQVFLFRINTATGAATQVGAIGAPGLVTDISVRPVGAAAVPEPAGIALLGFGAAVLLGYARRRGRPVAA